MHWRRCCGANPPASTCGTSRARAATATTAPTTQFRQMAAEYRPALDAELARWKAILAKDLPALNRQLAARGLPEVRINK